MENIAKLFEQKPLKLLWLLLMDSVQTALKNWALLHFRTPMQSEETVYFRQVPKFSVVYSTHLIDLRRMKIFFLMEVNFRRV